jgi:DNA-binding NtrC family response regulator
MVRPIFLVIDREYSGSISTRKLVIETAKFNVITAYSAIEALDTLQVFPRVTGVVLDAGIRDMACNDLVGALKDRYPELPVVVISSPGTYECPQADHLLTLLQSLVPAEASAIEKQNEKLNQIMP